jgi:hypothetical protein
MIFVSGDHFPQALHEDAMPIIATTTAAEPCPSPGLCPYLSLAQAARRIPPTKGDRPVHVSTLTRWITKGVKTAAGWVIRLEARRFPGGWKVTEEAVDAFLDELTRAALGSEPIPCASPNPNTSPGSSRSASRLSARRQRELDRVEAELTRAGF